MTDLGKLGRSDGAVFHDAGPWSANARPMETKNFESIELSGVYQSDELVTVGKFGDRDLTVPLEKAFQSLGEWFGIFQNTRDLNDFVVTSDSFGYQSVFYRIVSTGRGTRVFVSGSAAGLTTLLIQNGIQPSVNWSNAITSLATPHKWVETINSTDTFGDSVYLLKPGQYLRINPKNVSIEEIGFFFSEDQLSYSQLLDKGIERSLAQLKHISKLPVRERRIYLSGGKDSRIMMAMLVAAGVEKEFAVASANYKTWPSEAARPGLRRDLELANTMRQHYGMAWSTNDNYQAQNLTFSESLAYWQSYRSNKNYGFSGAKGISWPKNVHIELRGAAGENFKRYWTKILRNLDSLSSMKGSKMSFDSDARIIFSQLYRTTNLDPELVSKAEKDFVDTLYSLGGDTLYDALDRHFSAFRNRGHFGHINHEMSLNSLIFLPLSQAEFVAAGQLLSADERENGAVYFDIIERLDPRLNDLEFDSNQWQESIRRRRSSATKSHIWEIRNSEAELNAYFENEETNTSRRRKADRVGPRLPDLEANFDAEKMSLNEASEVLHELRDIDPDIDNYAPVSFSRNLLSSATAGRLRPQSLVSKLHSIRDMVVGNESGVNVDIFLDPNLRHLSSIKRASRQPFLRPDIRPTCSTLSQTLSISIDGKSLIAEAKCNNPRGLPLEFSFSLYVDKKNVRQSEYSTNSEHVFNVDGISGDAFVRSDIRYKSATDIIFSWDSSMIQVP